MANEGRVAVSLRHCFGDIFAFKVILLNIPLIFKASFLRKNQNSLAIRQAFLDFLRNAASENPLFTVGAFLGSYFII